MDSQDEPTQRATQFRHYQNAIDIWLTTEEADRQTRDRLLSGGAAGIIREFEAAHSLPQRPRLHSFVAAVGRGMAAAYRGGRGGHLDHAVGVFTRYMELGVLGGRAFLGVQDGVGLRVSPEHEHEKRQMMDLLVATVRRILGARETLLAVPRQLDLMWAETRPTGPIYRCFATMNFSAEDPACFDLAECLRMAGGRPLRLRDFIWANVYLALA